MKQSKPAVSSAMLAAAVLMTLAAPARAAAWYAATGARPTGQGTLASPWDLTTALAGGPNGTQVQPGDTIWVRGGTYGGNFLPTLVGTAAAPIIVRNYPGERVLLDQAGGRSNLPALNIPSTTRYVWIWGLEIMSSNPSRIVQVAGSQAPPWHCNGVEVYGSNVKLINCLVYDNGNGIGLWEASKNSEVYGCLIFNNGWNGPDRGHGHGIYTQNQDTATAPSLKKIQDVMIWNNFMVGVHGYAGGGHVENYVFNGVISFNNGSAESAVDGLSYRRSWNLFLGPTQNPCRSIQIQNGYLYQPMRSNGVNLKLGYGSPANLDVSVQGCYLGGGVGLQMQNWKAVSMTGNTFYPGASAVLLTTSDGATPTGYLWDNNRYCAMPGASGLAPRPFQCSGLTEPIASGALVKDLTFTAWKAGTGLDGASTCTTTTPTSNWVVVRPNAYEQGRAHVAVYNWLGLSAVSIDLSGSGLVNGQPYEIRNAQNYFGAPVVTGTYSSANPTVTLPMTDTAVTPPVGLQAYPIPTTLPEFGAFVVIPR